jgi:hypothetical protein
MTFRVRKLMGVRVQIFTGNALFGPYAKGV